MELDRAAVEETFEVLALEVKLCRDGPLEDWVPGRSRCWWRARYFIYGFWLSLPDHVWLSGVKFPALLAIPTLQKCGHNPTDLRYRDSTWSSYENTSVWDVCDTIFDMFSLHVDTFEIFEYVYREIDGKLILYLSKENL